MISPTRLEASQVSPEGNLDFTSLSKVEHETNVFPLLSSIT